MYLVSLVEILMLAGPSVTAMSVYRWSGVYIETIVTLPVNFTFRYLLNLRPQGDMLTVLESSGLVHI